MDEKMILDLYSQAMYVTLLVSAPMMLVAMIIGLIVAVFQATTQINESTLTFVPKLFAVFITMLLLGPWILQVLVEYTEGVFLNINNMIT